jgi:hypothetical protein
MRRKRLRPTILPVVPTSSQNIQAESSKAISTSLELMTGKFLDLAFSAEMYKGLIPKNRHFTKVTKANPAKSEYLTRKTKETLIPTILSCV